MVFSPGLTTEDRAAMLKGSHDKAGEHLSRLLKFVVARAGETQTGDVLLFFVFMGRQGGWRGRVGVVCLHRLQLHRVNTSVCVHRVLLHPCPVCTPYFERTDDLQPAQPATRKPQRVATKIAGPLPTAADRNGDKSGIFCLGGRCDPAVDGDPSV